MSEPWVDGSLESGGDDDSSNEVETSVDTATREQREAVLEQAESASEADELESNEPPA